MNNPLYSCEHDSSSVSCVINSHFLMYKLYHVTMHKLKVVKRFFTLIPFVDFKTKQVKLVCHLHQPAFVTCWPRRLPHWALELMLSLMECSKLSLKGYFQISDKMFCLSPRTPLHFLCVTISQTGTSCSIPCSLNLKHSNTKSSFEFDCFKLGLTGCLL